MENKTIITDDIVESFEKMMKSTDAGDIQLAMDILDNRNKSNEQSENNFKKLMCLIVDNQEILPTSSVYGIKINNRFLVVKDKAGFCSEEQAKKWLSLHLTQYIGTESSRNDFKNPYLKALKNIFKSGINMRNFLIKNNIIQIVNLNGDNKY
jgi:hypothetical protein